MIGGNGQDQAFNNNRLYDEADINTARRVRQAYVELSHPDCFDRLVAVLFDQPEIYLRIVSAESRNRVRDKNVGSSTVEANGQAADLPAACALRGTDCSISCVKYETDTLKKNLTCRRQYDPSFASHKQLNSDFTLKPPDLMAEVRLRDPQSGSCPSEMELLSDGDEKP
jgi:hypothetical protein